MAAEAAIPFIWGEGGERLSPDAIKRRRSVAEAMIKSGADYSPIQHPLQGVNRVAQALVGAYQARQVDAAEAASAKIANANVAEMLKAYTAGSGSPDMPASGSSPASLDATAPVSNTGGLGTPAAGDGYVGDSEPVAALKKALGPMESGNRYDITGPVHSRMGTPLGKYQIMSANLPEWSRAAVGRVVSPQEFLGSPELQEKIAGHRMGQIIDQYGNLHDAASVWHSGRPLAQARAAGARDVNMSTVDYVNKTIGRMNRTVPVEGSPVAAAAPVGSPPAPISVPSSATPPPQTRIAAAIAPGASQAPAGPEVQQLVQAGILPEQITPGYLAEMWQTQPTLRDSVQKWRAGQGGASQTLPASVPMSPTPAAAVQRAAARVSAADIPSQGASTLADMPASGAQPAGFYVPPAVDGGEPTIVPTPDDVAPGAQPVQASPSRPPVNIPPATVRIAQALNPTAIRSLTDTSATDAERSVAMLLLQKQMEANKPETYTYQNIGGRLLRMGNRGSLADTGIGDVEKPSFTVIGEDEFGKKQYGWVDPRAKTAVPYNPPAGTVGGKPSTIPPVPAGVDPKAWRDAHSKAAAEGSATGNFDQEAKLRTEYKKSLGSFEEVHDAFGRVIASTQGREDDPKAKSPAADIALVFGYMKMLDPGSVVREGEYATAKNATGVPDRIVNTYNKLLSGEFLSPEQRQDFVGQAGRVYGQARRRAEEMAGTYRTLSKGYGINGDRVVSLPEALQVPSLIPKAAAPTQAPPTAAASPDPNRPAPRVVGPPPGQVARPTSDAEFTALPSGSFYVDPDDGRTYRKP